MCYFCYLLPALVVKTQSCNSKILFRCKMCSYVRWSTFQLMPWFQSALTNKNTAPSKVAFTRTSKSIGTAVRKNTIVCCEDSYIVHHVCLNLTNWKRCISCQWGVGINVAALTCDAVIFCRSLYLAHYPNPVANCQPSQFIFKCRSVNLQIQGSHLKCANETPLVVLLKIFRVQEIRTSKSNGPPRKIKIKSSLGFKMWYSCTNRVCLV